MKNFYVLENWGVVATIDNPYQAPEQAKYKLNGDVYGHSEFGEGENITTSSIMSVDTDTGTVITRSGSTYKLGTTAPEYEKLYPNARARLFKQFE